MKFQTFLENNDPETELASALEKYFSMPQDEKKLMLADAIPNIIRRIPLNRAKRIWKQFAPNVPFNWGQSLQVPPNYSPGHYTGD